MTRKATVSLIMSDTGMVYLQVHATSESKLNFQKLSDAIDKSNPRHGPYEAYVADLSDKISLKYKRCDDNASHYFSWMINKKLHRCFNGMIGPVEPFNAETLLPYVTNDGIRQTGYSIYEAFEATVKILSPEFAIELSPTFITTLETIVLRYAKQYQALLNDYDEKRQEICFTDAEISSLYNDKLDAGILTHLKNIGESIRSRLVWMYLVERRCFGPHDVENNQDSPLNNTIATIADIHHLLPLLQEHKIALPPNALKSNFVIGCRLGLGPTNNANERTKESRLGLDPTNTAKLKNGLDAYIKKIEIQYKNNFNHDFAYFNFSFFKTWQAENREANYLLAKNLLEQLNSGKAVEKLCNNRSDLLSFRRTLMKGKSFHDHGINSQDLNQVLKMVGAKDLL